MKGKRPGKGRSPGEKLDREAGPGVAFGLAESGRFGTRMRQKKRVFFVIFVSFCVREGSFFVISCEKFVKIGAFSDNFAPGLT